MRMELDEMINEFAQTPGAAWTSNVTWRGLRRRNAASRTEPTTANSGHTTCPRFARRAHSLNVALRQTPLEDLAELHLAGTALERAPCISLKSCATLGAMKLRHGCRLTPRFSNGEPAIPFHRPLQLLVMHQAHYCHPFAPLQPKPPRNLNSNPEDSRSARNLVGAPIRTGRWRARPRSLAKWIPAWPLLDGRKRHSVAREPASGRYPAQALRTIALRRHTCTRNLSHRCRT